MLAEMESEDEPAEAPSATQDSWTDGVEYRVAEASCWAEADAMDTYSGD